MIIKRKNRLKVPVIIMPMLIKESKSPPKVKKKKKRKEDAKCYYYIENINFINFKSFIY